VVSWFDWSKEIGLPVERMEDLVLVYGCTLVTSWAAAAFDDHAADARISLTSRALNNGGSSFHWGNIQGIVEYHDSQLEFLGPVCSLLVTLFAVSLTSVFTKSMVHPRKGNTASSSNASEQSASCSGPDTSGLRQNPFVTTLTTVKTMRYK
jgi:hypothetical protein